MVNDSTWHDLYQGAYRALYEDAVRWIPELNRKAMSWDQTQLTRLAMNRGRHYYCIDLPEFGKVFEASLEQGRLVPHSTPGFARLRTKRGKDMRPRLFWAFLSRVFKYDGSLRDSPCTNSIFLIRQLCYLFKKIEGDCSESKLYTAIGDLYAVEAAMDTPSLNWDDPIAIPESLNDITLEDRPNLVGSSTDNVLAETWRREHGRHYQRVFDLLAATLPSFDPHGLRGYHGPGAVSDGARNESKYSFPHWPEKLELIFPFDWHASTCFLQGEEYPDHGEVSSKLLAVPKTQKAPRLIASEPISNQWVQQAIAAWFLSAFDGGMFSRSIRIRNQRLNQKAARVASFGKLATVDLSEASDRISCFLAERVFRKRPGLLQAMMACRTVAITNAIDKRSPSEWKLRKFSTMGSALTFPCQSYIFFGFAIASVLRARKLRVSIDNIMKIRKEVKVYGDDIIIPTDSVENLMDALHSSGLKVNTRKTFYRGFFRESCGADFYRGCNVTPAYIRNDFNPKAPASVSTLVECSNNFHKKGMWSIASFLLARVPKRMLMKLAIGNARSAIKGIFSYVGSSIDHLKSRWDETYQRIEYKVAILVATMQPDAPDGIERLRQWFTESPSPETNWSPRTIGRSVPCYRERWVPGYTGLVARAGRGTP